MTTTWLQHNLVRLALHQIADGAGRPLLLLHGLGEASPAELPVWARPWGGPVYALDFTGHGQSSVPKGGGYTAEVLMGDADIALAAIGPATVVGRGVGAYVALLIAGARFVPLPDTGHFVHIERPEVIADLVLDFLG